MLAFLVTWALLPLCIANSFAFDDPLAYPRFRVELTDNKISESTLFAGTQMADGEVSAFHRQQNSGQLLHPKIEPLEKDTRIIMTSNHGQPFVCTIPNTTNADPPTSTPSTQNDDAKLTETNIEQGLALLKPLTKGCLYFHDRGYWTYEYCHLRHVRQFHVDQNTKGDTPPPKPKKGDEFYLGKTSLSSISSADEERPGESTTVAASQRHPQNHLTPFTSLRRTGDRHQLVQRWGGGTECDLTRRPRTIEIQFQCDDQPHDRIVMFQEVATCQYQMTIATPRLCEAQLLASPPVAQAHTIECNPVVPEHYLSSHEEVTEIEPEHGEASESEEDPEETVVAAESKAQQAATAEISTIAEKKEKEDLMTYITQLTKQVDELQRQFKASRDVQRGDGQMTFLYLDQLGKLSVGDRGNIEQLFGSPAPKKRSQVIQDETQQRSKAQRKNREAYEKNYYDVQ